MAGLAFAGLATGCTSFTGQLGSTAGDSTAAGTPTAAGTSDDPVMDPPVGGPGRSTASSTTGRPASVDVFITLGGFDADRGVVEVAGYVAGVVEDDGRCVLRLSAPGRTDVTAESSGVADAGSTACGDLVVPAGRLASGSWSARLEYGSSRGSGSSAVLPITIP